MILFPFFSSFFPPFSRGVRGFCSGVGAQSSAKHGGERVLRFFPCKRGGQIVTCDIFAPNTGGKRFFCPFFGGVFGSSVPLLILDGWASEKEAAEATRAEELGGEEEAEVTRRSRRRKKKKKKKKKEKKKERKKKEKKKNKKEGKKGKQGRKENRERKRAGTEGNNKKKRKTEKERKTKRQKQGKQ